MVSVTPRSSSSGPRLGTEKAHGQQNEIRLDSNSDPGTGTKSHAAVLAAPSRPCVGLQRAHASLLVADESLRRDRVEPLAAFLVRGRDAEDVRPLRPGLSAARVSGGIGISSSWCTARAPWRCAVPRQSAPVSPPPMMTTSLVLRSDELVVRNLVAFAAAVLQRSGTPSRNGFPCSSRPGTGRSRGWPAPPASRIASKSARRRLTATSTPTFTPAGRPRLRPPSARAADRGCASPS